MNGRIHSDRRLPTGEEPIQARIVPPRQTTSQGDIAPEVDTFHDVIRTNDDTEMDDLGQPRPDPRVTQVRTLSTWDVAALIVNKMVGTGIFTGPATVLRYTLNKNLAIGLWTLGLVYTLLR
jgi:hypothetical protein